MSVADYCHQYKKLAEQLGDMGEVITNHTLVMNLLRGLNEKYSSIRRQLQHARPFPTYQEVRRDLLLEELTLSHSSSMPVSALIATPPAPAPS